MISGLKLMYQLDPTMKCLAISKDNMSCTKEPGSQTQHRAGLCLLGKRQEQGQVLEQPAVSSS